jgi:lipopolysaccharide/colanic/teichoic acid biosynthesis glycosyltransferase
VLLSPVLFGVAALVAIRLGRPVIFTQTRAGLNGRPFTIYKFRTMRDATSSDGTPLSDEDRMTPLGAALRSWSLDELPELLNVLRGDMSLVGPRPLLMEYLPLYSDEQARRHEIRPGITGLAQVSGRNAISWEERLALDVQYVDTHTLALDAKILLQTVVRVLKRDDIAHEGAATMHKFTGSGDAPQG